MEREKIERVARKIARVHAGEPDGTVRAVVDGIEWALSHQWTRVADRKPQPDAGAGDKGGTVMDNDTIVAAASIEIHRVYGCNGKCPCLNYGVCRFGTGCNTPHNCGAADFESGFMAGALWANAQPTIKEEKP